MNFQVPFVYILVQVYVLWKFLSMPEKININEIFKTRGILKRLFYMNLKIVCVTNWSRNIITYFVLNFSTSLHFHRHSFIIQTSASLVNDADDAACVNITVSSSVESCQPDWPNIDDGWSGVDGWSEVWYSDWNWSGANVTDVNDWAKYILLSSLSLLCSVNTSLKFEWKSVVHSINCIYLCS